MNQANSPEMLRQFFDAQEEWLAVEASGRSVGVRRGEIEISESGGKIFIEFPGEKGFALWRAAAWKIEDRKITFDLTGRFGREVKKIAFVPRISAAELGEAVELARIEKANKIAAAIASAEPKLKLVRISLNKENGRFAHIFFENRTKKQTAVLADVSDALAPEVLLTTAILWLERLRRRKKNPVAKIRIVAAEENAKKLQKLAYLLRSSWRASLKILALKNDKIEEFPIFDDFCILKEKPRKLSAVEPKDPSDLARRIAALAPLQTDLVFSRGGETVRFCGLPFLRVRTILGEEKAWFGVESDRRVLSETNFAELVELVENLKIYRRHDSPNKRHLLYTAAPEAWLESILRRDIRKLDANLILSPVHNQFRVSNEKIDLLAARRDGRLVVVEIKTAPDRETVFQAADYWREIEERRRGGAFRKNKIFGELEIADAPALVYLVAPALSFHRDSSFFAETLRREIEVFRFDLNENWREGVKVLSRYGLAEKL